MIDQEQSLLAHGKEIKIGLGSDSGLRVDYDWRAFNPQEYIEHSAVHNTSGGLIDRGIKYSFKFYESLGKGKGRINIDFQHVPDDALATIRDEGGIIVNFHRPISITEVTYSKVSVPHEIVTRGRYLPWRKKPQLYNNGKN